MSEARGLRQPFQQFVQTRADAIEAGESILETILTGL